MPHPICTDFKLLNVIKIKSNVKNLTQQNSDLWFAHQTKPRARAVPGNRRSEK
jgi:hypothetical protein